MQACCRCPRLLAKTLKTPKSKVGQGRMSSSAWGKERFCVDGLGELDWKGKLEAMLIFIEHVCYAEGAILLLEMSLLLEISCGTRVGRHGLTDNSTGQHKQEWKIF